MSHAVGVVQGNLDLRWRGLATGGIAAKAKQTHDGEDNNDDSFSPFDCFVAGCLGTCAQINVLGTSTTTTPRFTLPDYFTPHFDATRA